MSATEVIPETALPQDRPSFYRDRALILTVSAALLGVVALVTTIADAELHDRIPDPVPNGLCILACTVGLLAAMFWARCANSAAFGAIAAELVRLAPPPMGEVVVPDDMRRISRESFELGRRVEQRRGGEGLN